MEKKTYMRSFVKLGQGLGITIPIEAVREHNFQAKEYAEMDVYENGEIRVKKTGKIPEDIRPEIVNALNMLMQEQEDLIKNLQGE